MDVIRSSWEVLLNPLIVCARASAKKERERDSQERQLIDEPIVRARFSSFFPFLFVIFPICCLLSAAAAAAGC